MNEEKPKKKKAVKKKISKKDISKIAKGKSIPEELVLSQIHLYQYCQDLSTRINDLAIVNQDLSHRLSNIEAERDDLKKTLVLIGQRMTILRDKMIGEEKAIPNKYTMEDFEDDDEDDDEEFKDSSLSREIPLHDDVTKSCSICGNIYHKSKKKCPECGFKKKKE